MTSYPHDPISHTTVLQILVNEYPCEVATLVELPLAESIKLFKEATARSDGLGEEDAAARIADFLRVSLGLSLDDTEGVTALSPGANDRFDEICAASLI